MNIKIFKVGLVGAGYIAPWHASAIARCQHAELVGVCDKALHRAERLAGELNVKAFSSLDEMVQETECQAVHALVPPVAHRGVVESAVDHGLHVLIEKPMAPCAADCEAMTAAATKRGVRLGVNHNFLFLPSSEAFAEAIAARHLGPLRELRLRWAMHLPQITSGPHDRWPFDAPAQPLLEVGPHVIAFVRRVLPNFELTQVEADDRLELPLGRWCYRRWFLSGSCDDTRVEVLVDFAASIAKLDAVARGLAGEGRLDFGRDLFTLDRPGAEGIVLEPWFSGRRLVKQLRRGVWTNFLRQAKSLDKLSPFGLSLTRSVTAFYAAVSDNYGTDPRQDSALATQVVRDLEAAVEHEGCGTEFPKATTGSGGRHKKADVLVTGGTGFIGRALVENLVRHGWAVRVLSRSGAGSLVEKHGDAVEIVNGDLANDKDVSRALEGVKRVAHLARANVESWEDYLVEDVEPTMRLGQMAADAGVERFVYTGTIDSYDAGTRGEPIDDETPLDPRMGGRNYYAQAKAAGEKKLLGIQAMRQLPLVIVRPGIVIGRGGPPAHWGVAMWPSPTTCRYWGCGDQPLPFVLVEDVAEGLRLALEHDAAVGRSFLLVGPCILTGQEYVQAYGEAIQTSIDAKPRAIVRYFAEDLAKYLVKRAVGRRDPKPSFRDWMSRTQRRGFKPTFARDHLGWKPAETRERLVQEGIFAPAEEMLNG